jgi:hypothetical protein
LRDALRSTIDNSRLLSGNIRRKLQHSVLGRGEDLESLYLDNFYSAFSRAEQQRLLTVPFDGTYDSYLHYWKSQPNAGLLPRMLYADQKTYLVELLMKQDQMSMACSIESRVPFLDHEFVEFAATVPDRLKLRGGVGKYILKRAVEDILPRDIVYRKKMGFPTPLRQWLMEPSADALIAQLHDRDGLLAPYIDFTYLNDLLPPQKRPRRRHRPHLAPSEPAALGKDLHHQQDGRACLSRHESHPSAANEPCRNRDPRPNRASPDAGVTHQPAGSSRLPRRQPFPNPRHTQWSKLRKSANTASIY